MLHFKGIWTLTFILGLAVASPSSAQEGRPVGTCSDGDSTYVLFSSGNIVRNGVLIDDGTGTKQIIADRGILYTLKTDGQIWRYRQEWEKIYDGNDTSMIAAGGGSLYLLKQTGLLWKKSQIWYRDAADQTWKLADANLAASRIWVVGGQVYCEGRHLQVYRCRNLEKMEWEHAAAAELGELLHRGSRERKFRRLYGQDR